MTGRVQDILPAAGTHASRPAATTVANGSLYSCTDHSLVYRSDGSAWSTWATLGGSSGIAATIVDAKGDLIVGTANDAVARKAVGTNGYTLFADSAQSDGLRWGINYPVIAYSGLIANKSFNSATETAISTTDDVTVAAVAGDRIEIHAQGEFSAVGQGLYLLAYSMVGGVKQNLVANYPTGWRALSTTSVAVPFGGSWMYTVVSGDLSGGNLTVRVHGATDTASPARSANGVRFIVKNWGQ